MRASIHPGASISSRTARRRWSGWGHARFEGPPRLLVNRRHAHVHSRTSGTSDVEQNVAIANNHRSFRDEADWRPHPAASALRAAARESVVAFNRLIGIGRRSDGNRLVPPGRTIQFPPQYFGDVSLDQNDRGELVAGIHLELNVIAAGEAIVAAMGAASIRVQRPVERHTLYRVQGGTAADLLILSVVRASVGLGQRGGTAGLDDVGDVAGAGRGSTEIAKERKGLWKGVNHDEIEHSSYVPLSSWRLLSP